MQVNSKATGLNLSTDLDSYLEKRLEAVEKLIPDGVRVVCDVELARPSEHHEKGNVFRAEINLEVDGKMYRATAEAETIQAAIDGMQGNLLQEMRRDKRKNTTLMRQGGARVKNFLRGFGIGK